MPYTESEFAYGPVIVLRGKHKGRVGEFDDDTFHRKRLHAIVKFAHPLITPYYTYIPVEYLELPNTQQLMTRYEQLSWLLSPFRGKEAEGAERIAALEEFTYVSSLLNDRMFSAQFVKSPRGAKIFISHSSADKTFVRSLAVDLASIGHQPWVDEWQILAGESIVERVGAGIEDADFMVVVLSKSAVSSQWVENEWQAKYWTEVTEKRVVVIPVVVDDCTVPTLLRAKKYVDFRQGYTEALELLSKSIGRHLDRKTDG
ncbi:toll/interleukin-1 receptor domain-containing protein [Xenophilus arseniciresistens]|uniref:Toll/interleukin-1 receptor domain-containing protein n=1 Tax=Xenophilus arseniciresistens TaxID=1283306 RepID=A0AAE3T299_9BURK|nr:toll/interleukin-1 receptor domain-containing protein [Xenophilus arseniciresistens]MDA7418836.1 toll/interleukin-1 receptor domain-containing protein [Xenophilus arseniciresistens]